MLQLIVQKIKLIAAWILAIIVVIGVIALLCIPFILLRKQGKQLQLHPNLKILDTASAGSVDDVQQLDEVIKLGKAILDKAQ